MIRSYIIFYFAGHGITRKSGSVETGYLALPDSFIDQYQTSLWTGTVVHELESLTAKHVLIIIDACFSGLVLKGSNNYRASENQERDEIYLDKVMTQQVRYVITAGRVELVDDNASPDGKMSLFTYYLLSGLQGDIKTTAALLTASELAVYLRKSVGGSKDTEHLPDYGHLPSSDRGEFIFHLPSYYVAARSFSSCNVEDNKIVNNEEKLILQQLRRTATLTVLERITIGQSGSSVYLVNAIGYNSKEIDGLYFCKVYRTPTGEEAETHRSVARTSIGKYIPKLVDSTPHLEGWMASLYDVAHKTTLRGSQPLSSLINSNFLAARDAIVKVLNLLEIWNPLENLLGKRLSLHSLLLLPLRRYAIASDPTNTDIVERIISVIPEMTIDTLSIGVEKYVLPNPVAYYSNSELWAGSRAEIYWPCGNIHGDLHTNNILCLIDSNTETISGDPTIIDFDTYESDGNILYDLAYLELDIAMRMYNPTILKYSENPSNISSNIGKTEISQLRLLAEYREYWPKLSSFLARSLLLPPCPPLNADSFAMYSLILPIREVVAKICSKRKGDFEAAYWIARTSAGLSFARKRKLNPIDRKVAILLAAHSLDKALHELDIPHAYRKSPKWIQWFD